ncbi:c-type cytochrome [Acetobacter ascendens]|uniref:Alcohol dehydrogenase n=1 Tax=Acetobacter ascendens TaxID=481146 RepID=A0A1D8QVQ5_9PROT|nr:cytochrome c [Acetobacter ascendens]AOW46416.1 alcohol dehydrogenase [Acetobacter ascendens]AOW49604.1 alcohol dehydrogenase [Acetobacter ascendens]
MRNTFFYTTFFLLLIFTSTTAWADSSGNVIDKTQSLSDGADIYKHICQSCHMSDGKGAEGAGAQFPALAKNPKLQSAEYVASVVLNGMGAMPWFAVTLDDQQIANVANYIRTHFDNHYTNAIKPDIITMMRPHLTEEYE